MKYLDHCQLYHKIVCIPVVIVDNMCMVGWLLSMSTIIGSTFTRDGKIEHPSPKRAARLGHQPWSLRVFVCYVSQHIMDWAEMTGNDTPLDFDD